MVKSRVIPVMCQVSIQQLLTIRSSLINYLGSSRLGLLRQYLIGAVEACQAIFKSNNPGHSESR